MGSLKENWTRFILVNREFSQRFMLLEFSDEDFQGTLMNVFALGSRLGLAAGWTAMAVMTVEIYPTVIRLVKLIHFEVLETGLDHQLKGTLSLS